MTEAATSTPRTPRAVLVELVASREGQRPWEWHELLAASELEEQLACRELNGAVMAGAIQILKWQSRSFLRLGKVG